MKRRRVSVAEAKNQLPALIHEAESTHAAVEITRRGKTVAVLVSSADYERGTRAEGFVAGVARVRAKYGEPIGFTKAELATTREGVEARSFAFDEET